MYIFFVELKKKENFFFFFFFSIFSLLFSFKLPYYSPITPQHSFSYIFMIFFNQGKICFSFSFFWFFFFFFLFFLLLFFLFFFFFFLSYFLLKFSNTPLLILNFHFHLNINLQKKKKRERSPIFKLNFIYISKFWVFVFVFKYFISKSLTSMLNFLIFVFQYVI